MVSQCYLEESEVDGEDQKLPYVAVDLTQRSVLYNLITDSTNFHPYFNRFYLFYMTFKNKSIGDPWNVMIILIIDI